jgi:hypothetical protein
MKNKNDQLIGAYKSKKGQSCRLTPLLTNPLNSDTKLQF